MLYIYLVVDNFSRKILAWQCSTKLSAAIRLKTIHDALKSSNQSQTDNHNINLIVDGGSENNNALIENFISQGSVSIHKKIALKDIFFSNSMIEAVIPNADIIQTKDIEEKIVQIKAEIVSIAGSYVENRQRKYGQFLLIDWA